MDRRVIVYLHGFCSSPASWKVGLLRDHVAARCPDIELIAPALSPVPAQAMADVEAILAGLRAPVTFMGSSLGGHYATYLAEKHGRPAAIINPAVIRRLEPDRFIGEHENFHSGERFLFTREHAEQLDAQWVPRPTPGRYLVLLEEADEVLDYRHAVAHYAGSRQIVLPGGDHSFTRFPEYLGQLIEFARL